MKIALGTDHAGFNYKEAVKQYLQQNGHEVIDKGAYTYVPGDAYPEFIRPAAEAVPAGEAERAIVFGGSGNGEAIVANRVRGIRCALCWNVETARLGRQHNDANCISLGERMVDLTTALEIVRVWLETPFEGGRHAERIAMIDAREKRPAVVEDNRDCGWRRFICTVKRSLYGPWKSSIERLYARQ